MRWPCRWRRSPASGRSSSRECGPPIFERDRANARICPDEGGCLPAGTEAGLRAALESLASEAAALRVAGKHVVVRTTSPYPGFDVAAAVRKAHLAGKPVNPDWSFDFDAIRDRSMPIDAGLLAMATHGVEVIDLPPLLCEERNCRAMEGGIPLYTDNSHLRGAYVATAGRFLDPILLDPTLAMR